MEEETQMGNKIGEGRRGDVNFKRVGMRCTGCFKERAEDNYVNMMTA